MKARIGIPAVLRVLVAGLAAYLSIVSCIAADRPNRSIDSGQPRDLINQPVCWLPDQPDDGRHCDFAERI